MNRQTAHPGQVEAEALHREALQALTAGRLKDGIALLEKSLAAHPKFAPALNDLATAYWQAGQPAAADKAFAQARAADPKNPHILNAHGAFLLEQGRHGETDPLLTQAFALMRGHAGITNNLGLLRYRQRRFDEAWQLLLQAIQLKPGWANPYANLGRVFAELGMPAEAEKAYRQALGLNPRHAAALSDLGDLRSGHPGDEALDCLTKSLALAPSSDLTWTRLITCLEQRSRLDEAQEKLEVAKARFPSSPGIIICEMRLLQRQGKLAEAVAVAEKHFERVKKAPPLPVIVTFLFEAGKVYDRVNDTDKAFECFSLANRGHAELQGAPALAKECRRNVLHAKATFTPELMRPSCPLPFNARPTPVFLVGFPRSGTTLLDQILTSHPDIDVAGETPAVTNALQRFVETFGGEFSAHVAAAARRDGRAPWAVSNPCYPAYLDRLRPDDIAAMRDIIYRDNGWDNIGAGKKILVDKMPLNLLFAGFIHRLFPEAKFILALRHPGDCVLSCFMQQFELNAYMSRFLDLKDAARFYDEAFSLWQHYTEITDIDVHTIHYEDVVANFRPTVAATLDFLGVGWNDAVLKYDETARKRQLITTPSYHQVTEKLYTRASGRWLRYRKHMEPVLDILAPHALRYGYAMDAQDSQK